MNPLNRLLQLIKLERKEITSIYFFAIMSGLVQLSLPVGVQAIIGLVLGASMVVSIYVLIGLVVGGVFLVGIFRMNQMRIIETIQQKIFTRNAFEFAEKIPRLDLNKTDDYYLPEKVNRFFDTLNIQKGLSKILLDIPVASIQVLFGTLLLSLYHPVFIVLGLVLFLVLWLILKFTSPNGIATSLKESKYKYAVVAWLEEVARLVKSFKFSQGTPLNLQKTDDNVVGYLQARTAHFNVLLLQYKALVGFQVLITAGMLLIGTNLLVDQKLNIGEFIAAEIVILTIINAVAKLIGSLDKIYDIITGLEKLATVTENPLEKEGTLSFYKDSDGLAIEASNLSFDYPDGRNALRDVNFSFPANSSICVFGPEGSGKTSLLKLLTGIYTDFSGNILVNKAPLQQCQPEILRNQTGVYLSQQDIFSGTLLENISMGRPEITPDRITRIAGEAGLVNFLNAFPKGYETMLEPLGKKLTFSLSKKVLLLRALAHEPRLLLLEEPWRGLDETVKEKLVAYLLHPNRKATVFVVSSDEDFAAQCDYCLRLDYGSATIIKNKG